MKRTDQTNPTNQTDQIPQPGQTVQTSSQRDATETPLAGRTIVVTRSRDQASSLSSKLRVLGATVIEIPTIAIVPPASYAPLDEALGKLASYDWLVVTSANTARVLGKRLSALGLGVGRQPRTVAVGPATAAALREAGLRVDLQPRPSVAESVAAALEHQVAGQAILLARAEVARDLLPVALEAAGARVTVVEAYRTVLSEESLPLIADVFGGLGEGRQGYTINALTFTSSSTVHKLFALLDRAAQPWPEGAKVFSIGPITTATLREHGIEPDGEAGQHDVDGLVRAVVKGLI